MSFGASAVEPQSCIIELEILQVHYLVFNLGAMCSRKIFDGRFVNRFGGILTDKKLYLGLFLAANQSLKSIQKAADHE
jgi:hypothetical protein